MNQGRLLTSSEVAATFGVTEPTIWRWARSGTLPGVVRLGQRVRFSPDAIQRHLEAGGHARPAASPDTRPAA